MTISQRLDSIPDLLAVHALKPDAYPYLLASNLRSGKNSRYSMLLSHPQQVISQWPGNEDCLSAVNVDIANPKSHFDLPFCGGWFVFLSYEYAQLVEPGVKFFPEKSSLPIAFKARVGSAIIVDHKQDKAYIVVENQHQQLIAEMRSDIAAAGQYHPGELAAGKITEDDPDAYLDSIVKTKKYIRNGDIFQANLSRKWHIVFEEYCDPLALYYSLRDNNPAQFSALVKYENQYIISSSPERLVAAKNGIAQSRPIAGTYPRGKTRSEDIELSKRLLAHPKEKAEHIMLIDLVRNDLGRFCQAGSIRVTEKMVLESYEHVHHIVSNIQGIIRTGQSVADVIHAVFPGGTITGCPKVRCMQIISEFEQTSRGAYTGSLGYIGLDGQMDFNILIRTLLYNKNQVSFRAGAGIVHDSIPEKELLETRHKAQGLLNAIGTHG